jgi:hypothetical protein
VESELVFDPIGVNPGEISHYLSPERSERIFEVHVKDQSGKFVPFPLRFVSRLPFLQVSFVKH